MVVQSGLSVWLWVLLACGSSYGAVLVLLVKLGAGIGAWVLQSLYGGLAASLGVAPVVLASWSSYALAVGLSSLLFVSGTVSSCFQSSAAFLVVLCLAGILD